ncbi:MAG: precorrin-2 C(20)-methyltransferase [Candidatus Nitrospinota bacterium M3_3B_026]
MTAPGALYGIGVGPGDPGLITVTGAELISKISKIFVPIARIKAESLALDIARRYVSDDAEIVELVFPMVTDKAELSRRWDESARTIADALSTGEDACFVTLGDPLLYSTYIYLLRALKKALPGARVVTIPGVTAFNAVAALTSFPVGEGKEPVTIIPAADDLGAAREAIERGGTVVLMKVGKRLQRIIDLLEELGVQENAVFVSNAGMEDQRVETDLSRLRGETEQTGYMSTILVHAGKRKGETA